MSKVLYDIFEKTWKRTDSSSIWLYSDPHFGEPDLFEIRGDMTPDEQVRRINSKVGKYDTIIFLGDIGDIEYIKKIRGYKVLILGNHDKGKSNYERVREEIKCFDSSKLTLANVVFGDLQKGFSTRIEDNKLFDEVYDGELTISNKIRLTHIPEISPYVLNIHGHCHPYEKLDFTGLSYDAIIKRHLERTIAAGIPELNLCCEYTNFYPINLNAIVKSGILKLVKDPVRDLIDSKDLKK